MDVSLRDPSGLIRYRVSYTVRSWGTDIENLLRDHVKSLIVFPNSKIRRFILKWHRYITPIVGGVFFLAILSIIRTLVAKKWQPYESEWSMLDQLPNITLDKKINFI